MTKRERPDRRQILESKLKRGGALARRAAAAAAIALALAPLAQAERENAWSTRAIRTWGQALTEAGFFGSPRWATAALPTCGSTNKGAIAYDLTTDEFKGCDGSAWGALGGGSGDVTAASNIADNALVRGDGGAKGIQQSQAGGVLLDDNDDLIFEGTADDFETTIAVADATADQTITFPDLTGTILLNATGSVFGGDSGAGGSIGAVPAPAAGDAAANKYLKADGTWAAVSAGIGGSTGSTDNAILVADGTGGATLKASSITQDANTPIFSFTNAASRNRLYGDSANPYLELDAASGSYLCYGAGCVTVTSTGASFTINNNIPVATNNSYTIGNTGTALTRIYNRFLVPDYGTGTDGTGPTLTLAGGPGTGAGTPGAIIFQTSATTASGTTAQTLVERGRFDTDGSFEIRSTGSGTPVVFSVPAGTGTGADNITIGEAAGDSMVGDAQNILIGTNAGTALAGGSVANVAIGHLAMDAASGTGVDYNVAVGNSALGGALTGGRNVAVGATAGVAITSGSSNTLVGDNSGAAFTTGSSNTLIGSNAGAALTTTRTNTTCVGAGACNSAGIADTNTAVGQGAIVSAAGDQNVAIGAQTLGPGNSGANGNIAVGYGAGSISTDGDYDFNIFLGYTAGGSGQTTVTDYCIAIGYGTDCEASNETFIGVDATGFQSKTTIGRSATGSQDIQALTGEQITLSTGGTTTNSSGNIVPANSIIDAIACRVTTEITTATEWGVSITGSAAFNQIGTTDTTVSTLTAGTTAIFVPPDHNSQYNASATTITITTTGTPGAGVVRCAVHYRSFTAPTS